MNQKYLQECLLYSAETGKFQWKSRPEFHFKNKAGMNRANAKHAGKNAG